MHSITESGTDTATMLDERSKVPATASSHDSRPAEPHQPRKSILRRLIRAVVMSALGLCGVVFGMYKMHVDIPALQTPKLYAFIDSMGERVEPIKEYMVHKYESFFGKHEEEAVHEEHKIIVTSPIARDVTIVQPYVCQIRSRRHIEIKAFDDGYLEAIPIKEGQLVKAKDVLFQLRPVLFKAKFDAEVAERDLAELELKYTQTLADKNGVSPKEVSLFKAKLARAQAKMEEAKAELEFTTVRAPFDGLVDRLMKMQGDLIKDGDVLTTLSDNSVMWVYFNVTEKRYLEYMAESGSNTVNLDVELVLANQNKFPHMGKIDPANKVGAIESNFNNETGNIAFRADFPNPDRLLRHGQTGTVLIKRAVKNAIVIPQRATFENLAKRYVFVVDKEDKVHQREINIEHEQDDIFIIQPNIDVNEKIILEGIRQVHEGEKVEFEFRKPEEVMANQKNKAE